jgi:tripartite-type tricarboxylate transporter receptor subunit TctC
VPFGAGGSTDIVARLFAQRFSEVWGQTLVVDNRAGAAGIIGTEMGARAPTDGHTIFTYESTRRSQRACTASYRTTTCATSR